MKQIAYALAAVALSSGPAASQQWNATRPTEGGLVWTINSSSLNGTGSIEFGAVNLADDAPWKSVRIVRQYDCASGQFTNTSISVQPLTSPAASSVSEAVAAVEYGERDVACGQIKLAGMGFNALSLLGRFSNFISERGFDQDGPGKTGYALIMQSTTNWFFLRDSSRFIYGNTPVPVDVIMIWPQENFDAGGPIYENSHTLVGCATRQTQIQFVVRGQKSGRSEPTRANLPWVSGSWYSDNLVGLICDNALPSGTVYAKTEEELFFMLRDFEALER